MSDLIERQKAIDKLDPLFESLAIDKIKALPPAEPEIIRCKDCKYCDRGIDEDGNPFLKCLGWAYCGTQEDDFCSYAKRKASDERSD